MAQPQSTGLKQSAPASVPFWRDIRFIQIFLQVAFLISVIGLGYLLIHNLLVNLERSGLMINFSVLNRPFGAEIAEGQADFDPASTSNLRALLVGLQNTLRVVGIGLVGATVLGVLAGIG